MDKALTQMEANKLSGEGAEETNHPDQFSGLAPKVRGWFNRERPIHVPNLPNVPSPPPDTLSSSKGTQKPGH
ncbi:unnamed protein product [Arabis nemorensis]|uniref:Uncharacterized protein n=1 Tax=Arabis nemorensis TaxID=586526 RepID=A0A565BMG4_9BRAS|nr:unnamed protein product [Arabis nemorensis]